MLVLCSPASVDIHELLHAATAHAQLGVPPTVNIALRVSMAKRIIADAAMLQQALHTMLQRACTVSRSGTIVVGAGYMKSRDRAFFYVRDAGPPMSLQAALAAHSSAAVCGAHGHWTARLLSGTAAAHRCGMPVHRSIAASRTHSRSCDPRAAVAMHHARASPAVQAAS